jgi:membrane protease YdiL (CAAX protease family)
VSADELVVLGLSWLILAAVVAPVIVLVRLYQRRRGQPLLPPQRRRAVPWTGAQALLIALLAMFFWPLCVDSFLVSSGFYQRVYGPAFPMEPPHGARTDDGKPGAPTPEQEAEWRTAVEQRGAWAGTFAFPLEVATVILGLHWLCGAVPFQLGLTTYRLAGDSALGCLAWLGVIPVVYAVQLLTDACYRGWMGGPPEPHPLTQLLTQNPTALEWVRDIFVALIAAPVIEELLFRGVFQLWMIDRPLGAWLGMGAAFAAAVARAPAGSWALRLGPPAFVLLMVPPFALLGGIRTLKRRQAVQGIYAASLLFAAAHSSVWPTPVPLFVLALALGWLAWRTQSLTAPVVLHVLFNGLTILMLGLGYLMSEPGKGNETTSAVRPLPTAPTSSTVPGFSPPRRTYASAIAPWRGESTEDVICPTSWPSRNRLVPCGSGSSPATRSPTKERLTWP